jgi:NDP-sugar pyrophosphorylase family protein
VRQLAAAGKVKAHEIKGHFWVDVDDPDSMDRAEEALMEQLREKLKNGWIPPYI